MIATVSITCCDCFLINDDMIGNNLRENIAFTTNTITKKMK